MAQVITRPITRLEALELAHDMILLETPDSFIRSALLEYGFGMQEADRILREAHNLAYEHETHINPRMMAFGLALITTIMLLTFALLLIATL